MQGFGYTWGNFEPETQRVVTVLLTGFDNSTRKLVGRFDVLWREFMSGGWANWRQLPSEGTA